MESQKAQTATCKHMTFNHSIANRCALRTTQIPYIIDQVVSLYSFVLWIDVLFVFGLGRLVGNCSLHLCRAEHTLKDADSNDPY